MSYNLPKRIGKLKKDVGKIEFVRLTGFFFFFFYASISFVKRNLIFENEKFAYPTWVSMNKQLKYIGRPVLPP